MVNDAIALYKIALRFGRFFGRLKNRTRSVTKFLQEGQYQRNTPYKSIESYIWYQVQGVELYTEHGDRNAVLYAKGTYDKNNNDSAALQEGNEERSNCALDKGMMRSKAAGSQQRNKRKGQVAE
jgi:hypothetical protein